MLLSNNQLVRNFIVIPLRLLIIRPGVVYVPVFIIYRDIA